eukprot:m51a1_g3236 hypothetical protein (652) ;mRNA; r:118629-120839
MRPTSLKKPHPAGSPTGAIQTEIVEKRRRAESLRGRKSEPPLSLPATPAPPMALSPAPAPAPGSAEDLTSLLATVSQTLGPRMSMGQPGVAPAASPSPPPPAFKTPLPVQHAAPAAALQAASPPSTPLPPQRQRQLGVAVGVGVVDIAPVVVYSRETQTESAESGAAGAAGERAADARPAAALGAAPDEAPLASPAAQQLQAAGGEEMPRAEADRVMGSEGFADFLSRASRVLERAMRLPDVTIDYTAPDEEAEDARSDEPQGLELKTRLYEEGVCKNRVVTDIVWSSKFHELLLAAYSDQAGGDEEQEGVVALWSPLLPNRPETVLTCQSTVTSAIFSPVQRGPTVVVGGTKSGHIVLWDTRASKRPVSQAAPSHTTHTYPVYSLVASPSLSQGTLTSLSSDGRLCVWSLSSQPLSPLETFDVPPDTSAMGATSMAALPHSPNKYLIGTENGLVLTFHAIPKMSGTCERVLEAHGGPVLSIDCHPESASEGAPQQPELRGELSQAFLTCSADWTARLWRSASPSSLLGINQQQYSRPLRTFSDGTDYIYDVRWSPTHAGIFARADGAGVLSLWDVSCAASEEPQASARVGQVPLSRLRWAADGRTLAVGDAGGAVHLYGASLRPPLSDGWEWFSKALTDASAPPLAAAQE